jgi:hypothetical protein
MGLIEWIESGVSKLKWYDISLVKMSTMCSTLFLMTVWPAFANFVFSIAWYYWLILMFVFAFIPMKRWFFD